MTIYVWGILAAVLVTAVLSAAEMAFIAANRLRIRHQAENGHGIAARYLEAFRRPERMLSAAMMGVTVAQVAGSSLATWALLPVAGGWAAALTTAILVPIMLVFGEVIPKAVAGRPFRRAMLRTSATPSCTSAISRKRKDLPPLAMICVSASASAVLAPPKTRMACSPPPT